VSEAALHEVVEHLAPIDRTPCSAGEREAAHWLAERFRAAGVADVELQSGPSWGTFPPTVVGLGAVGLIGGLLALSGRRLLGAAGLTISALGVVDEAQNGPRIARRLARRERRTVNVVARIGDPKAPRRLVLLAHHDAPQSGVIFDQSMIKAIHARWPDFVESRKTPPPQWWIGVVAPALGLLGALTGRRRLSLAGAALGVLGTGLVADIMRNATVPGANDNLSGVAVQVALAEMLRDRPLDGVEVWLVSCGAEETMQDGIRAFVDRNRSLLNDGRTVVVNNDTVGSPNLIMLEGEGPIWMEDYPGPKFRDLVQRSADANGIALERGLRARSSTDSVITARQGWPTASITSLTDWRIMSNYHQQSDTPENLDYDTVARATELSYAVAAALAAGDA
jgi:hypothetical protein